MNTCLELGLCQNKKPLCDDCEERPLRGLRSVQGKPTLGPLRPKVPVVWSAPDPAHSDAVAGEAARGDQAALPDGAARLGSDGASRGGAAELGQDSATAPATWRGAECGIRRPERGETPLSDEEIEVAILLRLAHDVNRCTLLPVRRRFRAAGTWSTSFRQCSPSQPFDALLGRVGHGA